MDNSKGRYFDRTWSLVEGCTPCSPGCAHCWSAAMSFENYTFTGNKTEKVKQIGNAVPVRIAEALVKAVINKNLCP